MMKKLMYSASSCVSPDGKTSAPTYRPAKPEPIARKSSAAIEMPVVFLGKKRVIHECLRKKSSSFERSAASSNTLNRYKSEITITIRAMNRQPRKPDAMLLTETKEETTMRTTSL